jgi:glycosyltransferase involved in cell wall biosynthesis
LQKEEKLGLQSKLGLNEDNKVLTFIGTFGKWHGVDILALAIKQLVLEEKEFLVRHKMKFLLIGDGTMMPTLKKILSDVDYSNYVVFTGLVPQKEAPSYLDISHIFLSPHVANSDASEFFGSPTKLFEYMAMKKSIIASGLGQINEIHSDALKISELSEYRYRAVDVSRFEKTAILCEPGNVNELIQGIKFAIENPVITELLAKNSYEKVIREHTWKSHTEKIVSGLQKLRTEAILKNREEL